MKENFHQLPITGIGSAEWVVFSDFDGTVTAIETFNAVLELFTPEAYGRIIPRIYNGEMTIKDGVRALVESIPSSRYPEMLAFVAAQPLRPGLPELLDYLDGRGIPLVIVSGGLRGLVEAGLGPLTARVRGIYAPEAASDRPNLRLVSEYEGETEILAKVEVMNLYGQAGKIAIGDGITDLNMAGEADIVFARDYLADHLKRENRFFEPWDDFRDVLRRLMEILPEKS